MWVKIWHEILWKEGGKNIAFTQKAVCYFWICEGTEDWKCVDDPIKSAHKWCETFGKQEKIEMVDMEPVAHSKAFAFVVTDFMKVWAQHTALFLVDLTCKYFKSPSFPTLIKL